MKNNCLSSFSRRHFIASGMCAAVAAALAPRFFFAEEKRGIVPTMIEIHSVRRNISVLEGSGGILRF